MVVFQFRFLFRSRSGACTSRADFPSGAPLRWRVHPIPPHSVRTDGPFLVVLPFLYPLFSVWPDSRKRARQIVHRPILWPAFLSGRAQPGERREGANQVQLRFGLGVVSSGFQGCTEILENIDIVLDVRGEVLGRGNLFNSRNDAQNLLPVRTNHLGASPVENLAASHFTQEPFFSARCRFSRLRWRVCSAS